MADLETGLKALILQNNAVATAFGQRYYIDKIPDGVTYPVIRAQTINDAEQDTHSNTWGSRALIQVDIWDDDKAGCNTNAALVRGWLHRYTGAFSGGNATIKVRNAPSIPDPNTRLFRRILEVEILYFNV
jgi:hypothetical protein